MDVKEQISRYIASQPEPKRFEMEALHRAIQEIMPGCKLWFLNGKNSDGKTVSNPNIVYGLYNLVNADGTSREFYQIGLSANTSGISVYIMGIKDKTYLANTFGKELGKASVSGYCIKFRKLKDIKLEILQSVIRYGCDNGRKTAS